MLLTPEHEALRDSAHRFINQEINPYVDDWEEAEIFPSHELFKKLGEAGFLGIHKPEKYGGMGLDYSYAMIFAETVAYLWQRPVAETLSLPTCTSAPSSPGSVPYAFLEASLTRHTIVVSSLCMISRDEMPS